METVAPDKRQLTKQYQDAVEYLDRHYAYFMTHVLHVGRPEWTAAIPTAAVAMQQRENGEFVDEDGEYDFKFLFNPQFSSKLSTPGRAFILAHETLHIVLSHLRLVDNFVDRPRLKELNERQKKGERLSKSDIAELIRGQQNAGKFNIAADCVINDYLVTSGMDDSDFYNTPGSAMYNPELPDDAPFLCRGIDKIGTDASYLTVNDVFERLTEQARQEKQQGGGNPGDGSGDSDGRGAQALDSHDWLMNPDFADEMADAIDKLNDEIEQAGKMPADLLDKKEEEETGTTQAAQKLSQGFAAGSEAGNIKDFMGATGSKLGWVKLMKALDPDIFKEPGIAPPPMAKWNRRPRKLGGMPESMVLPVREKAKREKETNEIPAIVLMLDVSGSIGPRDADRFIELAKSIPQERVKLLCATFNTQYSYIPDLQDRSQFNIGGGTNFDAIPNFIEDVVKPELKGKYPKAVVIITDGEASLSSNLWPEEKEGEGWYWLISPTDRSNDSYYNAPRKIGRKDMLEEYIL